MCKKKKEREREKRERGGGLERERGGRERENVLFLFIWRSFLSFVTIGIIHLVVPSISTQKQSLFP